MLRLTGRRVPSRAGILGILRAAALAASAGAAAAAPESCVFTVEGAQEGQVILGLGFEIQSDSIGSGNDGLPNRTTSVPWDLTPSERERFYTDMLGGFRYVRLALGLYFRGLTPDAKHIVERWPGQAAVLSDMVVMSGVEGLAVEYWSPAPGWKSNGAYIDGTLVGYDNATLAAFAEAVATDALYLEAQGLPVVQWGLQNEPAVGPKGCTYSCAGYSSHQYYLAQKATAAAIRKALPHAFIHASAWSGQYYSPELTSDTEALENIDGWSFHHVGSDSNDPLRNSAYLLAGASGRPVFSNEYEYLQGNASAARTLNTAQNLMNWLSKESSPMWYWLHALKPLGNSESSGYGLGYWQPLVNGTADPLPPGTWEFNYDNFNALAGFVRYMPWDSPRLNVTEDVVRDDVRVLAYRFDPARARWMLPPGATLRAPAKGATLATLRDGVAARAAATKLAVVLTNRLNTTAVVTVQLADSPGSAPLPSMVGHGYAPNVTDAALGTVTAVYNVSTGVPYFVATLQPLTIQFWTEA